MAKTPKRSRSGATPRRPRARKGAGGDAASPPSERQSSAAPGPGSAVPAAAAPPAAHDDPAKKPFTHIDNLDSTRIAIPLLDLIANDAAAPRNVIIDVNLEYRRGRREARIFLWRAIDRLPGVSPTYRADDDEPPPPGPKGTGQGINYYKSRYSEQYLFGILSGDNIRELVRLSEAEGSKGKGAAPLYRIWLDHEVVRFTNKSISTVKADAAHNAFHALGNGIVWAVADTGIDDTHPHWTQFANLDLPAPLRHRDFTGDGTETPDASAKNACIDKAGHGTHVAGIIAGSFQAIGNASIKAEVRRLDEMGKVQVDVIGDILTISGMAPECRILSLKVLGDEGTGLASNMIAALEYIQELNGNGRRILVHGLNLSVGYDFEPKWFACGQSPLCVEVNRLVRSGVVVVVAAGNTGYGYNQSVAWGTVAAGQDLTINDPGNAEMAITVGSTHRDMPHVFGVSFFSSKGPTGDGRLKPDLVAPGEKIISCRSSQAPPGGEVASAGVAPLPEADSSAAERATAPSRPMLAVYKEDSGTSMAAPHVSGVIAAFLSVRREFIGRPETVKDVFVQNATDLKRATYFQGKGLVDLMRAIQSV